MCQRPKKYKSQAQWSFLDFGVGIKFAENMRHAGEILKYKNQELDLAVGGKTDSSAYI